MSFCLFPPRKNQEGFQALVREKVEKKPCFPSSPVFRCRQWCFPRRGKFFTNTSFSRLLFSSADAPFLFCGNGKTREKSIFHFFPAFWRGTDWNLTKKCICNIATSPHKDLNRAEIVQIWTEKGFFDAGDFERDFSLDLIFDFSAAEKRGLTLHPSLFLPHCRNPAVA